MDAVDAEWRSGTYSTLGVGIWRRGCAAGLSAAAVGLLANELIATFWHRPRPYQDHPLGVIPLLSPSHGQSFPSDHATAAFAIAFGILFITRRAGWVFLAWAVLIGVSRVLAGMHHPTDVIAGAPVGFGSGYFTARVAIPLLDRLIRLASRITDPSPGIGPNDSDPHLNRTAGRRATGRPAAAR